MEGYLTQIDMDKCVQPIRKFKQLLMNAGVDDRFLQKAAIKVINVDTDGGSHKMTSICRCNIGNNRSIYYWNPASTTSKHAEELLSELDDAPNEFCLFIDKANYEAVEHFIQNKTHELEGVELLHRQASENAVNTDNQKWFKYLANDTKNKLELLACKSKRIKLIQLDC